MVLQLLNEQLLDAISELATNSKRQRMNYNFHHSTEEPCQRFINAVEPDTVVPIHKHNVDEMILILRGRIRVFICDEKQDIIEDTVLNHEEGNYGCQIPAGFNHYIKVLEPRTVMFEIKEGPYRPNE